MAEIPDIARSKLRQQAQPTAHPDANLLAAFAEQTLVPRERETVTAHLARCAQCREYLVVAYRAQEPEPAAADATPAARPARRWLPAWRWIAPAAVACCIVAVALQYHVSPTQQKSEPAPAARAVIAPPPKPAPAAEVAAVNRLKTVARAMAPAEQPRPAAKKTAPREFSAPPAQTRVVNGAPPAPYAVAPAAQANDTAAALPAAPQQREPLLKAEREALAPGGAGAPPASASTGLLALQSRKAYAKAKPPAQRMMASGAANLEPAASGVRWSINASPETAGNSRGVVQRSTDAGSTWQAVPLSERVSFLAVAATGAHVWAGGSEGALFHSSDGGLHWERITVRASDASLTGAIVHIDVVSAALVKITTSTGEHWSTADGGANWQRE